LTFAHKSRKIAAPKAPFASILVQVMAWKKQFGQEMKRARLEAGLTQAALGKLAGVRGETIRQYELGLYVPGADIFAKIVDCLHVDGFEVNGHWLSVCRAPLTEEGPKTEQLSLDFDGSYAASKANIRIRPGSISITITGGVQNQRVG
jgi:transcriptional regulator with XRE-family HTH domain